MARQWGILLNSVFFVLGFSLVFSLLGIILQTVLLHSSFVVQQWLGSLGGVIIILFGISLLGLIHVPFLERDHKVAIKRRFRTSYLTSFIFGAAFAFGWTPCVGAVLGGILTLALVNPGNAFWLLLAYSLGLGFPFLLIGMFTQSATALTSKITPYLKWVNYVFGSVLIALGILALTNSLGRIANFSMLSKLLLAVEGSSVLSSGSVTVGISFLAGLGSFLSPCVMPLAPAFLAYLVSTGLKK